MLDLIIIYLGTSNYVLLWSHSFSDFCTMIFIRGLEQVATYYFKKYPFDSTWLKQTCFWSTLGKPHVHKNSLCLLHQLQILYINTSTMYQVKQVQVADTWRYNHTVYSNLEAINYSFSPCKWLMGRFQSFWDGWVPILGQGSKG